MNVNYVFFSIIFCYTSIWFYLYLIFYFEYFWLSVKRKMCCLEKHAVSWSSPKWWIKNKSFFTLSRKAELVHIFGVLSQLWLKSIRTLVAKITQAVTLTVFQRTFCLFFRVLFAISSEGKKDSTILITMAYHFCRFPKSFTKCCPLKWVLQE